MEPLENKVALVTGAGRGIGRAIALALARAGCRVILSSRTQGQLDETANTIHAGDGQALVVPADLTRDEDIQRLIDSSLKAWGGVNILVNNAGWGKRAPVVRAHIEDWDQTFRLNLRAPMILAKSFLPGMIEKGSGAVINIGSVSGKTGEADGAAYAASKFGLIGFTQSLYEEVQRVWHQSKRDPAGLRRHADDSACQAFGSLQDDSVRGRRRCGDVCCEFSADMLPGGTDGAAAENTV